MKKTGKLMIALLLLLVTAAACHYDWIAPEDVAPVDPGEEVSFAAGILPIFNDNNNCTACHKGGGVSPDLTSGNAYAQINKSKYINTATPGESLLYKAVAPGQGMAGHKTITPAQAALLLAWISQGAKNN